MSSDYDHIFGSDQDGSGIDTYAIAGMVCAGLIPLYIIGCFFYDHFCDGSKEPRPVRMETVEHHGTRYPHPPYTTQSLSAMAKYEPKDEDLFINTFVKAGTTWTIAIVHQLLTQGKELGGHENIDDVYHWMEVSEQMRKAHPPVEELPTLPRILKSHLLFSHLPFSSKGRYIYVCRDPVDCLISYSKMKQALDPQNPDLFAMKGLVLSGNFVYGGWAKHVAMWWDQRSQPNVLFLFFEDLKKDQLGSIRKIADFLGVPLGKDMERSVTEHTEFSYMKERRSVFNPRHIGLEAVEGSDAKRGTFDFVRKGKIGDDGFLPAERLELYTHYQSELRKMESDFPMHERYMSGFHDARNDGDAKERGF
jgi:hypothetical protein